MLMQHTAYTEEAQEAYRDFTAAFKALAHAKALTATHLALRALVLNKPLGAAFTPITNATKLANGQTRWQGAQQALASLKHAAFRVSAGPLHTPEEKALALSQSLKYERLALATMRLLEANGGAGRTLLERLEACTVAGLEAQYQARQQHPVKEPRHA